MSGTEYGCEFKLEMGHNVWDMAAQCHFVIDHRWVISAEMLTSGQELHFIFGQTQLEMKEGGTLGSRVGCCSNTVCTKLMT